MKRLVGFGAGGHAEVVLEMILGAAQWETVALLEADAQRHGTTLRGIPIVGGDDRLAELVADGVRHGFCGIAGFGDARPRVRIYDRGVRAGLEFIVVVHPRAVVSESAVIDQGSVVMANAVVNTGSRLAENVIVNTAATVDHHCTIGRHVHLAPGAHLAGHVEVGDGAQIGMGAAIREGVRIGSHAVIGAGAVVLEDVPADVLQVGAPARTIKQLSR